MEWLTSFCSECDGAVTHARGRSEGSQGCREDADDDLQDGLPSLFLHGVNGLGTKIFTKSPTNLFYRVSFLFQRAAILCAIFGDFCSMTKALRLHWPNFNEP